MGSEDFYPEERPVREIRVDGFWMDEHPVTAAEFRRSRLGSTNCGWSSPTTAAGSPRAAP